MKWIILIIIRLYWKFYPVHRRNNCLFRESCSSHVYRISYEKGFKAGIKAFLKRYRECRPEYQCFFSQEGKIQLKLKSGTIIDEEEIADSILFEFRSYKFKK